MDEKQIDELFRKRIEAYGDKMRELGFSEDIIAKMTSLDDLDPEEPELTPEIIKAIEEYGYPEDEEPSTDMEKKTYRTVSQAGAVAKVPNKLAVITNSAFQHSTSFYPMGDAHLQALKPEDVKTLTINKEEQSLYFEGFPATVAKLKSMYSDLIPTDMDLSFLQMCYSIILANYNNTIMEDNTIKDVITIYLPHLFKSIGLNGNFSRDSVEALISKLNDYANVIGVLKTSYGDELQPVLLYMGEDRKKNTISIASPYLTKVIERMTGASVRVTKAGKPITDKNGNAKLLPMNTFLISPSISKERNKYAVQNVFIIAALIEQAGDNIPHIKASTIVERNVQLKEALDNSPTTKNKNTILQRAFTKTWELLQKKTDIARIYKDIQLPEPGDAAYIPTSSTLDKMIFEFPHKGKHKFKIDILDN